MAPDTWMKLYRATAAPVPCNARYCTAAHGTLSFPATNANKVTQAEILNQVRSRLVTEKPIISCVHSIPVGNLAGKYINGTKRVTIWHESKVAEYPEEPTCYTGVCPQTTHIVHGSHYAIATNRNGPKSGTLRIRFPTIGDAQSLKFDVRGRILDQPDAAPVEIHGEAAFDGQEYVIGFDDGARRNSESSMLSPYGVAGDFTWTLSLKDFDAAENSVQLEQTTRLEIYVVHHEVDQVEWFKGGHIPVALLRHVVLPYDGKVDYRRFLVDRVFNSDHIPFVYNAVNGGSRFGMGALGGSFYLSDWLKLVGTPRKPDEQYAPNYQVNCYDQAAIVQICLAFAFGEAAGKCWRYLQPFGYIGHAPTDLGPQPHLLGWGKCNNPFFLRASHEASTAPSTVSASALIAGGSERKSFRNHAFVQDPLNRVLDACAGPHYGDEDINQYIQAAIDHKMSGAGTVGQVKTNAKGVSMFNEKFGVTVEMESTAFVSELIRDAGVTSSDKVYDNGFALKLLKDVAQKVDDTKAEAAINADNVSVDSGAVHVKQLFYPPPEDQISFTVSVAIFPNSTLAEKAIVAHIKSYGGELQEVWEAWAPHEREGVDIVLVRDDETWNAAFIITNGNVMVEMGDNSSMDHDVISKQLTARAREVAKLLADGIRAPTNVNQPAPSLAIEGMSPSSDDDYQLDVGNNFRVRWSHVVCVEKDKENGALVFDARTAGTETITVWLGFEQASGSVKTQVVPQYREVKFKEKNKKPPDPSKQTGRASNRPSLKPTAGRGPASAVLRYRQYSTASGNSELQGHSHTPTYLIHVQEGSRRWRPDLRRMSAAADHYRSRSPDMRLRVTLGSSIV
ncbi:hypothetical protein GGX14DRAFT_391068 [Mycena pura]|uniref:Uncharacterized protein n=1 Tax=Mycena pura TaxID=153505 RepID=A0AAD6VMA3_9AGAR|nr:hypothetical protein GGX14DRAFT_391068 [Mycena pura]